jgi:PAS domain S-box-containing protein
MLFVLLLFSTITIHRATRRREDLIEQLRQTEERVRRAHDWLQTTVASIGDAVIATDFEGRIEFLNGTAQSLTGWTQEEAAGKGLDEVFVIRNEKTGAVVENPVSKVLREGRVVGLANHTILLAKDGRSIPIEDSAAPIRDGGRTLGTVLVFRDVTEERRAQDAVARSEARLKLALAAGQIGVWDWDVVHNRIDWSDRVYEIHGVERGTFPGRVEDFAELVHPDDRPAVSKAIAATLRDGTPYDAEFRVVRPSGDIVWISTSASVLRDEEGQPIRMLGATTDVTVRRRAEDKLRQQWQTFDAALSNTPDFTYVFDLDGRFTYINRALLSLWQKSLEDSVGKNFLELGYPADLAERLQRQIRQVIESKESVRDQTPFTGPTGETRHYEYIFVPILAADGSVEAVAGSTRDITERNTAEEALRKSEERLTLALEAGGGVGTWDWDIQRDLVYCSPQFAALFSMDANSAANGSPLAQFLEHIHPDDRPLLVEYIGEAVKTGGEFAGECRVVQPDGSVRWVHARGRCHRNEAGDPSRFPGVVFDITERKRAEEDLRNSNEELKRANRELEEFAYVASHDLQEPLRMVNIYTQLILRDLGGDGAKLAQYAEFVRQGVVRMEGLIHDLLTFSRAVHSNEPQVGTADLSAALGEALTILKNRIEESNSIITAEALPTVRGDASQMAHVFQNLVSNALKYRKKDAAAHIQIRAERDGNEWIVSVRDNGIGFDPQYADRIFGLFKRLHKEQYPGTGLGLAICKRILERFDGRIWADARPGEGATFYFALPAAEES